MFRTVGYLVPGAYLPDSRQLTVITHDISKEKSREEELERRERRYRAIFDDPNLLIALTEPDGTVIDSNETTMTYVDATVDDVIGRPLWEAPWFTSSELRSNVRSWIERAANNEYVPFEAELSRSDGATYIVEGIIRPVTDETGTVRELIVSDRDITARKSYERTIRTLHEVATELTSCETPQAVYEWTITAAAELLELDRAVIAIEEDDILRVEAMSDALDLDAAPTLSIDEGIAG